MQNKIKSFLTYRLYAFESLVRLFIIIVIFSLLLMTTGNSRQYNIKFDRLSIEQGLSQNTVLSMLQDSRGFMWFGTQDGLNRYDGLNFKVYRHEMSNPSSLTDNEILSLYEDYRGNIWIGTSNGGVNRYEPGSESFKAYREIHTGTDTLHLNGISALCVAPGDSANSLWIGTLNNGIIELNLTTEKFSSFACTTLANQEISLEHISALICSKDKNYLWIGTSDKGLYRYEINTGQCTLYQHRPDDPASIGCNSITSILEDQNGNIWTGTTMGVYLMYAGENTFTRFLNDRNDKSSLGNNDVRAMYQDHLGHIWIGTWGGGLNRYDEQSGTFIRHLNEAGYPCSLSDNKIFSIYEDRSGIIWIGTWGGGLNKFDLQREHFEFYRYEPSNSNSISSNDIMSIIEDSKGLLWIGTTQGGLNRFDVEADKFTHFKTQPGNPGSLSDNTVMSICEDQEGKLWVGTWSGGLNRFDRKTGTFVHYMHDPENPASIGDNNIWTLLVDQNGQLWIGTRNAGLDRYDRRTGSFTHYRHDSNNPSSISDDGVSAIYEDREGNLWIGTSAGGLNLFDKASGHFISYRNDPDDTASLSHNCVWSIHEDRSGTLWVGTKMGLNRFDRRMKAFKVYTQESGLPNNVIYQIEEDRQGNLWLSTNHGLSRFSPSSKLFTNFDARDGLQSNEFNLGAACKRKNGQLIFGGINGFNIFNPDKIIGNQTAPSVVITRFQILNADVPIGKINRNRTILSRSIVETKELVLNYKDYVFSFEFAALHYSASEKNQYAYRMAGFEDGWNYVGTRNFATYTNIPPGQYEFLVKASNNRGIWNEEATSIKIHIDPPFWATWWFRLIMLMVIVSISLLIFEFRTRTMRKHNAMLESVNLSLNNEILERKNAEEALRESEEKYRNLIEQSNDAIYLLYNGRFEIVNNKFREMFVLTDEDINKPDFSFLKLVAPKSIPIVEERVKKQSRGEPLEMKYEFCALTLQGAEVDVEAGVSYINYKDGIATQGIIRDITERKKMEEQLRQAQKMEAVGQLAGGVAHDFNNLLTVINGYCELILNKKLPDTARESVQQIKNAGERAARLTSQLLTFSRKQVIQPRVLNLNAVIQEQLKMLGRILGEDIDIKTDLHADLDNVKIDRSQLEQIVLNIAVNARDAMPFGGELYIETVNVKFDNTATQHFSEYQSGEYVRLRITDSGVGMDDITLSRIFEPFYTTKGREKGTGLGLATVYGIVKQNGGYIKVESKPGSGTSFMIFFPKTDIHFVEDAEVAHDRSDLKGSETILLVEDDPATRQVTRTMLEKNGYTVLTAENGSQAILLFEQHDGKIDLMLTDVIMPGMSGRELAEQIQRENADLKIIYISGYTDDAIVHHGVLDDDVAFIQKPYSQSDLFSKIREVLGS